FLLGAGMVSPLRFLVLNLLGGVVWTLTIGLLGYAFGITLEAILGDLKHYEIWIFAGVLVTSVAGWVWHLQSRNKNPEDPAQRSE
ncbi:MAG: DedA family protein, partial [Gammaproteobacteria bacterium]|nr:DedA family protein [Gammaproteobacteria bacterium]